MTNSLPILFQLFETTLLSLFFHIHDVLDSYCYCIKLHKLRGLKQHNFLFYNVLEFRVCNGIMGLK